MGGKFRIMNQKGMYTVQYNLCHLARLVLEENQNTVKEKSDLDPGEEKDRSEPNKLPVDEDKSKTPTKSTVSIILQMICIAFENNIETQSGNKDH